MTTDNMMILDINEAKAAARAELLAHRERIAVERAAKARREQSAEEEIAHSIQARRADEAQKAERQAQWAAFMADRERKIAEAEAAYQEHRKSDPLRGKVNTNTPARRAAQLMRQRLGDDFGTFLSDLRLIDWKNFQNECARIPVDEHNEAVARQRAELVAQRRAEAATLPTPEDDDEREILARYGFAQ